MSRTLAVLALAVVLLATPAAAQESQPLDPRNVLTWPRAPVDRFGCMLERHFDSRDPRFNCTLRNYVNRATACTPGDSYYEGPTFPAGKAGIVEQQLDRIELAHEGGRVQAVTLILKQRQTRTAIGALFGLPLPDQSLPANVSQIDIQGCRPDGTGSVCNVVLIEGFDHIGAADADCGEEGVRPEPAPQPGAAPAPAGTTGGD